MQRLTPTSDFFQMRGQQLHMRAMSCKMQVVRRLAATSHS